MANLSNVTYVNTAGNKTFIVPFSYIDVLDITVTVDDVVTTAFVWSDASTIEFTVAPADGASVYISRDSDVENRIVSYSDGAELTAEDLNNGANQSIYLQQETRDLIGTINAENALFEGRVEQNEIDIASNDVDIAANTAATAAHLGDTVDAHDASAISNVPSGNLAATDQQSANNELQSDIDSNAANIATNASDIADNTTLIAAPTVTTVDYTPAAAPAYVEGRVFYDNSSNTLSYYTDATDVKMDIGQEMWVNARNNTGVTLSNGDVVYITGSVGQKPTIALADATTFSSAHVLGIVTADILNNANGYVTTFGLVNDVDTSAYTDGDELYLSTTAGQLTATAPSAPNKAVHVCTVINANPSNGQLLVVPHFEVGVNFTDGTIFYSLSNELTGDSTKFSFDATTGLKLDGGASVTTILDEDTLVSDSATALATQQSIKAYVDAVDADDIDDSATTNKFTTQLHLDTVDNTIPFFEGGVVDAFTTVIASDGATISVTVEKVGTGDFRAILNGTLETVDCTPAQAVSLTAGTDVSPVSNYVYFNSSKVLSASTVGFPTGATYIPVATVICQSAASLQTDGAYKVHLWTDKLGHTNTVGHLADINKWIRSQYATYVSGIAPTFTITTNAGAADNLDFASTSVIPTLSITARIAPPAITPVPCEAGLMNTKPPPKRPNCS